MRLFFRRARVIVAFIIFVACLAAFGAADLYFCIAKSRICRAAPSARRRRIGRWQARWARVCSICCRVIGGVRVSFAFDRSFEEGRSRGPFIIIANHFGAFDGLVMADLLRQVGNPDFRPVAKAEVGAIPIMGRAWREYGTAFVERDHRKGDADAVSSLAEIAREDGANVIIFPEGTVLCAATAASGPRTLLPPKLGGFRRLVRALPGRPILSLTMYWRDFAPYKLSDEGLVPPGADVLVECRLLEPPAAGDADRVLLGEWRRKEAWLRQVQ